MFPDIPWQLLHRIFNTLWPMIKGKILINLWELFFFFLKLPIPSEKFIRVLLVSPSLPQSEKLVPHIPLLTIVVIGFQKPYTKTEEGTGLELNDDSWRLALYSSFTNVGSKYSFSGGLWRREICCWWTWWGENHSEATDPCNSKEVLRNHLFALGVYSQLWPSNLLPRE